MTWLHAWPIYMGAAAAALPLAIHFLTRPKPVRFPLSTIRFVREAIQQRRARHRLRDICILALRTLAVLLIAWAVARPIIGELPITTPEGDGGATRVVFLDASQSMAAGAQGIEVFERARARAAESLAYQPGLRANLIVAGAEPHAVFDRASGNFAALRERLAGEKVRPERLNVPAALALASELLAQGSTGEPRELVVVSDFQRSNWAAADFSVLPEEARVRLESVALEPPPENLAIVDVGFQGRAVEGRTARCDVQVANFSQSQRPVAVELSIGDATYRLAGVCKAGETITLGDDVAFPAAGWRTCQCRLVDAEDGLSADNVRYFVVEVRAAPRCLLITRQSQQMGATSSYFLERALSPFDARDAAQNLQVTRHDASRLDDEAVNSADLIVLDHPGSISAGGVRRLAALVRRGRAVLYVAAEAADATNLQKLAVASGSDWKMPVEFAPPAPGRVRRDLFLSEVQRDRPPFRVFGDSLSENIASLRFGGGLTTRRREQSLADEIAASYGDRSAALVISSVGAGKLAVLNADLNSSNLAASPAFVPLIGELVDHLLDRGSASATLACGEPAAVYLPPEAGSAAGLRIVGPGEKTADIGEFVEGQVGLLWRMTAAGPPGVFQVRRGDATVFAVATEIPREESMLDPLDATVLTQRLSGGRRLEYHSANEERAASDRTWTWFAVGCVVCMLGELAALRGFRT